MSKNHNDTHRKKRGIKPYTLDKQYQVIIDGVCVMSYDNINLAFHCMRTLDGQVREVVNTLDI